MREMINLFSVLTKQDWWDGKNRPRQVLNQKFATVLADEDLSNVAFHKHMGFKVRPRMPASMKASGSSEMDIDKYRFQVSLDLDQFEVGEIKVKVFDTFVEVSGKHEDKRDEYGLVSREFCRRYWIPYYCDADALTSSFSTDGRLTIRAPIKKTGRRKIDFPTKVTVDGEESKPALKFKKEEYYEAIQKMVQESFNKLEAKSGALLQNREYVKALENALREEYNKFMATDKHLDESMRNKEMVC